MKKALVSIILSIILLVGAYAPTGLIVNADDVTYPQIYQINKISSDYYSFETDFDKLKNLKIEYTFYNSDVLLSKLDQITLTASSDIGSNQGHIYYFHTPSDALSFKIWRAIDEGGNGYSVNGNNSYIHDANDSLDKVQVRIKTAYINDDLITRERNAIIGINGVSTGYTFRMWFNLNDSNGNDIAVDNIYSIKVEYDVVKSYFWGMFGGSVEHKTLNLLADGTQKLDVWPFLTPFTRYNNIETSMDPDYSWVLTLGTFDTDKLGSLDVNLDQTSVLEISFYYNGTFYDDVPVVDPPDDASDTVDVEPGTNIPITTLIDRINAFIDSLSKWAIIILIIVVFILFIIVFAFIKGTLTTVFKFFKMLFWIIKTCFKIITSTLKFIFITIPNIIFKILKFLFIPKKLYRKGSYNA